jgi:hypothetical protein
VKSNNLTSPGAPTHVDVLRTDEEHRRADPHTGYDKSNPPAADVGTTHLFGARGLIDSTSVPTVPHTVDSRLAEQGSGSTIAETQREPVNQPSMNVGPMGSPVATHEHRPSITSIDRARREGSAS